MKPRCVSRTRLTIEALCSKPVYEAHQRVFPYESQSLQPKQGARGPELPLRQAAALQVLLDSVQFFHRQLGHAGLQWTGTHQGLRRIQRTEMTSRSLSEESLRGRLPSARQTGAGVRHTQTTTHTRYTSLSVAGCRTRLRRETPADARPALLGFDRGWRQGLVRYLCVCSQKHFHPATSEGVNHASQHTERSAQKLVHIQR